MNCPLIHSMGLPAVRKLQASQRPLWCRETGKLWSWAACFPVSRPRMFQWQELRSPPKSLGWGIHRPQSCAVTELLCGACCLLFWNPRDLFPQQPGTLAQPETLERLQTVQGLEILWCIVRTLKKLHTECTESVEFPRGKTISFRNCYG